MPYIGNIQPLKFNFDMKKFRPLLMLAVMIFATVSGFSQDPGGSPDGPPPAVPFEDYMHLILLAVGAVFALFTIKKLQRKQA